MAAMQKAKEKVQESGKKTRETLHRHGIAIPGWVQVLIWAIGVVTFTVLTFYSSLPLIRSYTNDDKNVAIQTTIFMNKNFPPPQFVLRIPHYIYDDDKTLYRISAHLFNGTEADCFECQQLATVHWDVWREANISKTDPYDIYYRLTAAFMRKILLTNESDFDALDEANSEWNAPVVDAVLSFLIWQYRLDKYFESVPREDSITEAIKSVSSEFANETVNGTKVLQLLQPRVFKALCQRMTLNLSYPGKKEEKAPPRMHCEDIMTNSTFPIVIDFEALWVPLSVNSGFECRVDGALLPDKNNISIWAPAGGFDFADRIWLYSDPLPLYYSEVDDENNYWWQAIAGGYRRNGKSPYILAQYGALMQMKEDRPNKKCYDEISPKVCVEKCGKRWTIEHCNCVPLSFHNGLPWQYINGTVPIDSLPYCTERAYNICNPFIAFNETGRQECLKECSTPCEYTSYNFVVYTDGYEEIYPSGFTVVLRPMTSDPVVQFSNSTKMEKEEFIAQLGGVIGLYLGLHCVSLLTFLINCIDYLQRYIRRRKDHRKRKTWAISLFRIAAMKRLFGQSTEKNDDDEEEENNQQNESGQECDSLTEEIKVLKSELERMKSTVAALETSSENNHLLNDCSLVHKLQCGL